MFMIEHILKQPSEVAGSQSVRVRFFSSVASPPWADFFVSCPHVHAEPVSGGGGRFVIWISAWCCLLLSIFKHHLIFFSSRWLAVGGLKSISVQMNFFFFCFVLSCLPQTHDHLAYAVCSLCRNCQRANKAHGHAWAEQGWRLGTESIRWSLGQTFRSNGFFDWTDCRNSRSCHVCTQKRRATIYMFPFNALHHAKRIPYRLWDFKNSN